MDPANPYRTIEVRGTARVEPDPDFSLRERVGVKYDSDISALDGPGVTRFSVTIQPATINSYG